MLMVQLQIMYIITVSQIHVPWRLIDVAIYVFEKDCPILACLIYALPPPPPQDTHMNRYILCVYIASCAMTTGGDQMTASRIRGSQRIRSNAERGKDQLQGLRPAVEDWHAKMCFLGVCRERYF